MVLELRLLLVLQEEMMELQVIVGLETQKYIMAQVGQSKQI